MPRRMITGDICRNEKVASLPDAGRFLFIGIFSNADDDGRLKASPRFLKALIFPYDEDKTSEQVKQWRDQCATLRLIRLYNKNGTDYLDLPGWRKHQLIRKDRYNPSQLPSYDEADSVWQPDGNQLATSGDRSIVKSSIVKSNTPLSKDKGARIKRADPIVNEIFSEMRTYLGFPDRVKKDPIPSYGKEGQAIKRMLARGFTREEVTGCWKQKVDARGGEFVSMTWVNEDIGKEEGKGEHEQVKGKRTKVHSREDFRSRAW